MYARRFSWLGIALNFSSHCRSARDDSAEKPKSAVSSPVAEPRRGINAANTSKAVVNRNARFIGPPKTNMKSARDYLVQNPAANQRKCGPFAVVRLNPINNRQDHVRDSAAHCKEP